MAYRKPVLVKTADAVVEHLRRAPVGWPIQFEAQRSYADIAIPLEGVPDGSEYTRVDVVPVNNPTTELGTRGSVNYKAACDIVVRKKFSTEHQDATTGRIEQSDIDAMVEFVQLIHESMINRHLLTFPEAAWEETEIRAAYIAKHLREWRQFTGIVRVTYDVELPVNQSP